ncbi:MAG: hypothetical protein A2X49_06095 [Lentisphaerae bacterium GWF2_52_8]|nr:MAG: hypothetical protein A2X49_06095 [Lentisphaerae bacterium GWF2_52_8]
MYDLSKLKVLLVDDDTNLLAACQRLLHKPFCITTCDNPMKALSMINPEDPFAVIVSDMHMPEMDGINFLVKVRERTPDTVRIMLTGDSDLQTAVDAVNEGSIFRFLTKPCEGKVIGNAILVGIQQYQLVTAERELLDNTLKGSIEVLVEILSMSNPAAFTKAKRLRRYVAGVAAHLHIREPWHYEIAALLSQLGCVTVPTEIVEKYFSGLPLQESEKQMVSAHPGIAQNLLARIPRMEKVAGMISAQQQGISKDLQKKNLADIEPVILGSAILKTCLDFDMLVDNGLGKVAAIVKMKESHNYEGLPQIFEALNSIEITSQEASVFRYVHIHDLKDGMMLADSIVSKSGTLVVSKGCEINDTIRHRLMNFLQQRMIEDSVRISFCAS